jgi:transposase-like protein
MPKKEARVFSREMKLAALSRMDAGENVSALARDLQLRRKLLYQWREQFRSGGAEALRTRGRPRKVPPAAEAEAVSQASPASAQAPPPTVDDLVKAKRRIAELERKIGQQQLELDFFQQALRQVSGKRRPSDGSGAAASTRSSKR